MAAANGTAVVAVATAFAIATATAVVVAWGFADLMERKIVAVVVAEAASADLYPEKATKARNSNLILAARV